MKQNISWTRLVTIYRTCWDNTVNSIVTEIASGKEFRMGAGTTNLSHNIWLSVQTSLLPLGTTTNRTERQIDRSHQPSLFSNFTDCSRSSPINLPSSHPIFVLSFCTTHEKRPSILFLERAKSPLFLLLLLWKVLPERNDRSQITQGAGGFVVEILPAWNWINRQQQQQQPPSICLYT